MYYEKIFVKVIAEFNSVGGMRPTVIVWEDGERFNIDKVKFIERAPCKSGGVLPIRFTVQVSGQTKFLYYERAKERFFVEREVR